MERVKIRNEKLEMNGAVLTAEKFLIVLKVQKNNSSGKNDNCQESKILKYELFIDNSGEELERLQNIFIAHIWKNKESYEELITDKNNYFWRDFKKYIYYNFYNIYRNIDNFIYKGDSEYTTVEAFIYIKNDDWVEELIVKCKIRVD